MKGNRKGQVTVEVAVLFTFVIGALIFMGFYVQRAVQGAVKGNADSFGQQLSGLAGFRSVASSRSKATDFTTDTDSCTKYDHNTGVDQNADGLLNSDDDIPGGFEGNAEDMTLLTDMDCDIEKIAAGHAVPVPREEVP